MSDQPRPSLPRPVLALGLVSLFMDMSSEMIHGLLPVFLVSVLGVGSMAVGWIEGVGEGTALIVKVFSGALSDWLGKRKFLMVAGYGLATLTKPLFATASTVGHVLLARSLDRVGKGIRGAPRDALIADLTPPPLRGAAYGLRQALDSIGAVLGPLLAIVFMATSNGNYRFVFWIALVPGLLAVIILLFAVPDQPRSANARPRAPIHRDQIGRLGRRYWGVVITGMVFALARFSEAFLLLRASDVGLAGAKVPVILLIMSLVFALGAYPVGRLSDAINSRTGLLQIGLAVLLVSHLVLAAASSVAVVALGAALWGLHMALTQGLLSALVADTAREEYRGTAFGIFGLLSGVAALIASVLAGWLWQQYGPSAAFIAGAIFSGAALVGFALLPRLSRR